MKPQRLLMCKTKLLLQSITTTSRKSLKSKSLLSLVSHLSTMKSSKAHLPIFPETPRPARFFCSDTTATPTRQIVLLTERWPQRQDAEGEHDFNDTISQLAKELLAASGAEEIAGILDTKAAIIFGSYSDGSGIVELCNQLKSSPQIGLEVFDWRKKQVDAGIQMLPEEYAKAIMLAGRAKNIDLAVDLFSETGIKGIQTNSTYNALMAAYMYNGLTKKSLSLFEDLKRDADCKPTIVTYNILLSIFGRSMLVDHMEMVLRAIKESNLSPNLKTFNTAIAGYVTAWMWDEMEKMFDSMKKSRTKPDMLTHLLMLRGYAHAGSLEKMEKMYELVKDEVNEKHAPLINAMICAYCKSSDANRVKKVEELMRFIPKDAYRPWLNVLLIKLYAEEDMVEGMEDSICKALEQNTLVATLGVMRSIISSYFRCNSIDRLSKFVKLAERAGWRLCRSLYHCKMVMYGLENRLEEMESVLDEMEASRFDPTRKTFLIMYKAYSQYGKRDKVGKILGVMFKHGFEIPLDNSLPNSCYQ